MFVVPGSVCEEHVDDLSQFVTNASRMQLLHDAVLIGKTVKDGTAKLGLTLSCKSTLLANDKSLGKLIVSHPGAEGVPTVQEQQLPTWGAKLQWGSIWIGRRRAKRVNRLCKTNPEAQKLTMTGIHLAQIYGHTAQGASTAQCKNFLNGHGDGKNPSLRCFHSRMVFGEKRVPQTAARVEQVSEWITMWRGFNVDTRRMIREVRRKKAPILARTPRRWNQATCPISATICSVLEAGWRPSTPDFWQTPDARATLDGALFDKAQIIDRFYSGMEMQTLHVRWIFMFVEPSTNLACVRMALLPTNFLCALRPESGGHQKARIVECPGNSLINHTHT